MKNPERAATTRSVVHRRAGILLDLAILGAVTVASIAFAHQKAVHRQFLVDG